MASFLWECFFCLLPCLFLLVLQQTWFCSLMKRAVRAAGWKLWQSVCVILELPAYRDTREWMKEIQPPEADILSGLNQTSDGPWLICKPTALAEHLLRHCGSLAKPKLASWPVGDPHLQTLSSLLCDSCEDKTRFSREHLLLKDGGIVALDWAVGTTLEDGGARRRWEGRRALGCFTSTPPVLLLIPHSWGGTTPHLKLLCHQATQQGFYVVVVHHRGTGGTLLTTPRLTEFGDPADLEQAVFYVHSRHPSSVLVAVSEGSGSGVLLSYLGEYGSSSYLTAAAAISPVLLGQAWFETAMPPLYHWGALFHRKQQLRRYESSFRGVLNVDRTLKSSSLRDFEEALFCSPDQIQESPPSLGGFTNPGPPSLRGLTPSAAWILGERAYPPKDWESYWLRNEPLRDADEVAVPILCICSCDDPLLPPTSTTPFSLFLNNPYFYLALTNRGGHCGFTLESHERGEEMWSHVTVLEYFRVVADFLKKDGTSWTRPAEINGQRVPRTRMNTMFSRKKRGDVLRRLREHQSERREGDNEVGANFTWKRSYTR